MLIGLDLGTSTCKVIPVEGDGRVVAVASRDYPMINLRPGWAEQSPDAWWRATGEAVADLSSQLGERSREVVGIGLCGQMHGLTPLDAGGAVIRPAILWNDQRAAAQCDWITERAGGLDELLRMTRNRMLTGVYTTEVSVEQAGAGRVVEHRRWSTELLEAIDVDPSLLPEVVESIEQTGTLAADTCRAWGLPADTPVFGGGGDAVIQTTAMGLIEEGSAGFTIGTAGIVAGGLSRCPDNPGGRVQVGAGNEPGRWHIMGVTLSAGGAFQWLRDALTPLNESQKLTFERLVSLARGVAPGAGGILFLPYLLGERSPHVAPDASASFVGLSQMHNVGHISRAVLEGVLMNMREILEVCVEAGLRTDQIIASGGATKEPLWLQLLADVLGREVITVTGATEGGAYGAALGQAQTLIAAAAGGDAAVGEGITGA